MNFIIEGYISQINVMVINAYIHIFFVSCFFVFLFLLVFMSSPPVEMTPASPYGAWSRSPSGGSGTGVFECLFVFCLFLDLGDFNWNYQLLRKEPIRLIRLIRTNKINKINKINRINSRKRPPSVTWGCP
jgi:hypothetical protein